MKDVLSCIYAKRFFTKYTTIKSYTHKMRGKNGVGQPVGFSNDEKAQIKKGIVRMTNDILKKI
jgi:hypothetical protein